MNIPEYDRRMSVSTTIRQEYMTTFPDTVPFTEPGIDQVPITWVNKRREEFRESWRVEMESDGDKMPSLRKSPTGPQSHCFQLHGNRLNPGRQFRATNSQRACGPR